MFFPWVDHWDAKLVEDTANGRPVVGAARLFVELMKYLRRVLI